MHGWECLELLLPDWERECCPVRFHHGLLHAGAVVATPFVFRFWGDLYGPTADLIRRIDISFLDILVHI